MDATEESPLRDISYGDLPRVGLRDPRPGSTFSSLVLDPSTNEWLGSYPCGTYGYHLATIVYDATRAETSADIPTLRAFVGSDFSSVLISERIPRDAHFIRDGSPVECTLRDGWIALSAKTLLEYVQERPPSNTEGKRAFGGTRAFSQPGGPTGLYITTVVGLEDRKRIDDRTEKHFRWLQLEDLSDIRFQVPQGQSFINALFAADNAQESCASDSVLKRQAEHFIRTENRPFIRVPGEVIGSTHHPTNKEYALEVRVPCTARVFIQPA